MKRLGKSTWLMSAEEVELVKRWIAENGFCNVKNIDNVRVVLTKENMVVVTVTGGYEVSVLNRWG